MNKFFMKAVAKLTQICWKLFYYLICFYKARTVTIYKQKKNNYISFRFWKLIMLLSTVNKVIETVTASQLCQMTEQHAMLSKLQMRVKESCFSETALNLLVNQMHAVWKEKNFVIFLLLLNIIDIFDQIISSCLVHVLCMKRISERLTKWVCIYITNHIIILMLLDTEIKKNMITAEVFQSSLLLLILYLFYTAELLDIYNNNNKRLNMSVFVNDITLLTYRFFTEINYHMLT